MSNLKDQVVFVTGAGGRIGKIIAIEFAKLGASVAIADLNEELLKTAVKEIEECGGKAIGLIANVTDLESMRKYFKRWFLLLVGLMLQYITQALSESVASKK